MNLVKNRLFISVPLIVSLLLGCYLIIPPGISDLLAYTPRQNLEHWQKNGHIPDQSEIEKQIGNIQSAINWNDNNAEYLDIKALLNYYQATHSYQQGDLEMFEEHTRLALQDYQKASQIRPNWPYSWANIALMKAVLHDFDAEYRHAILKATTLGPWENAVNVNITEAGLLGWGSLDQQTKQIVTANLERGVKRNTKQLKQRLSAINKLGLACILLKQGNDRKRLCSF